jgi:hypothetical protein
VDIGLFTELRKIESAMTNQHSVAEALAWCGENRGTLKKTKVNLLAVTMCLLVLIKEQSRVLPTYARVHRVV